MRKAMAEAEVGDDWYGDDPTVNRPAPAQSGVQPSDLTSRARAVSSWCGSVRSRATALADEGWLLLRTVAVLGILEAA